MRNIIKICVDNNLDLSKQVREYLKTRLKEAETGIYLGN